MNPPFDKLVVFGLIGFGLVGLSVANVVGRIRWDRARRAELDAWLRGQGLRLRSARQVARAFVPEALRSGPGVIGSVFYRVKAVQADGRPRSGFARMPWNDGRFAPDRLLHWEPSGPAFEAETSEGLG